jgi:Asp-tRNA(Asn)/Glu-tRNA(Gln) amidotransferase A subunit family amidase
LTDVAGVRTTRGSTIYGERIPERSDLLVTGLEARGGVVYAKSNTPEFGSGGHTYNGVLGITRNPWDLSRSAGGSSGGAAAALASGTAWVAHGSDLAGSLRPPCCSTQCAASIPARHCRQPNLPGVFSIARYNRSVRRALRLARDWVLRSLRRRFSTSAAKRWTA